MLYLPVAIESLAAEYEGRAVIAKVDIDSNQQVAQQFGSSGSTLG